VNREAFLSDLALLQPAFENSPAAMMLVDRKTAILLVNRELERITGFSRDELEGSRRWNEFVLSEDRDVLKKLTRMLQVEGPVKEELIECRFVDKTGNLKTTLISGTILEGSDRMILSLIDISAWKEHENMLKSAIAKAEASDRLKTAFLGNLSHEIRTPMNAIVGFASLLQMDELTEEKKKLYLAQIIRGSSDLLELIEKTIMISRIDQGQIKINRRQFFVNKRLDDLLEKYVEILSAEGKDNIELNLEKGREGDDFVVQADQIRVMDVLNNLLDNAVKFTESGSITFGYAYLEEEGDAGFDSLLFYVKDTGPGISREKSPIIFDRFVKLVDKNETVLRGAGLGLSISQDLVRLMGGDIWVETAKGQGSRFFFTIPLTFSKSDQVRLTGNKVKRTYDDWSAFEILVAEDMESNYLYIKELLAPTRVRILRARDGIEAVEIFENNPGINAVLMDILMPGLDGYEATSRIRNIRNDIPVIAQTAFTFEGEILDGLYAGCFTDYIMKPFTRDMLLASLKKHLALH
jgi:PAS domain S-box-containing protein